MCLFCVTEKLVAKKRYVGAQGAGCSLPRWVVFRMPKEDSRRSVDLVCGRLEV